MLTSAMLMVTPVLMAACKHRPWRAPAKFLALYPPADQVPPATDPLNPKGVPPMACNYAGNMQEPAWHCPTCIVPRDHAQQYRRHYYGAVSYVDDVVGRAVAKVDSMGVSNNTIVIFTADHGAYLCTPNLSLSLSLSLSSFGVTVPRVASLLSSWLPFPTTVHALPQWWLVIVKVRLLFTAACC